jgi:hypothetical protein
MVLPQLGQNLASGRTGFPQNGQATVAPFSTDGAAWGWTGGAEVMVVPQLPQNRAPGRTGFPQFGQVDVIKASPKN